MSTAVSIDPGGTTRSIPAIDARPLAPPRSRWWVEAAAIVWLLWIYDAVNNLAPLRLSAALGNARNLLHFEQTLGIAPEHALDRWLAAHYTLGLVLSDYYDNAHFLVTLSLLAWLWWRWADIYRPLRNSLVLVNLLGFIVFWRFPVAPPRMLAGFTDVVASTHAIGSWHTGALASQANELAAMPSLHISWAVWCTVAVWRMSERLWVRALATLYPCLTAVAVLATGNHFVLDIVGGLVAIALSLAIVGLWGRYSARRDGGATTVGRKPLVRGKSDNSAYRMSQSCYEVQDKLD
ncbi:MAG TPA: phosphatase PAP2 family protein [Solirubrobacteraceae bacterium]|nr:phosphatase PAP2 family protein [Solirubrobacteraceae bacterium]